MQFVIYITCRPPLIHNSPFDLFRGFIPNTSILFIGIVFSVYENEEHAKRLLIAGLVMKLNTRLGSL